MTKNEPPLYKAGSGIKLEISHLRAKGERASIILWPCTGGSFQMYRLPASSFLDKGVSIIQFNPPGHGRSEGPMNYGDAVNYFRDYISDNIDSSLPLILTGHSGGAGALLSAAPGTHLLKKFFLVSPVLDSRESLLYMYSRNTINEFNSLIASSASDKTIVLQILSNKEWMDPEIWHIRKYRLLLDAASGTLMIGEFLENLFIKGFNTFQELKKHANICRILLASNDNWYSRDSIKKLASENNIMITEIQKASDHYFTGAWSDVWSFVLDETSIIISDS